MEEEFDKLTPEEMFDQLEETTFDFRFSRHDNLTKILKKLECSDNKKMFEEMKMELWVQDLYSKINDRTQRFYPL